MISVFYFQYNSLVKINNIGLYLNPMNQLDLKSGLVRQSERQLLSRKMSVQSIAQRDLDRLIEEPGRHAILRRELVNVSSASESSCDRALQKKCLEERLVRISKGIYAIGQARMADLIPEVMPKLGYQILAGQTPKGYSQYCGGRVWRLDRACHRRIRRQGVYAYFETPGGEIVDPKDLKESTHTLPSQQEVEENYHSYIHCHSMARAEKELIVKQALAAMEDFHDDRCTFALTGGTSLAFYYRLVARFSEDIDIQFRSTR